MLEREVRISDGLGLHARASARVVEVAAGFVSEITIWRKDNGKFANARSILDVLHLGASAGTVIVIKAEGTDETQAIAAVASSLADGNAPNL